MQSIQLLLEQEAIKRLKARYFRCFGTKDWEGWFSVFTDDIAMEFDAVIAPKPGGDPRPAYRKVDGVWRIEKLRRTRLFFSATLTREVFVP